MADNFKQYDPAAVTINVGGSPMRGFANDSMIEIEYANDKRTMYIGIKGDGRHVKSNDRSGTLTLHLARFSPSNAVLTQLDMIDEPFPIVVIDKKSNGDLFFAASCTVKKIPNFERKKEEGENAWTFNFTDGNINHMGAATV